MMFSETMALLCVGALWGCTNPIIKSNSKDIIKIKANNPVKQFVLELKYLLTNVQYLLPMAINQCGSILYFITLQSADLSFSVPISNALTFFFTAATGWIYLGEVPQLNTIFGIILVLLGTVLCGYDSIVEAM